MRAEGARTTMGTTTISLPDELADELYARKARGESYADVIERLLAAADEDVDATSAAGRAGTAGTAGGTGTVETTDTKPPRDEGEEPPLDDLVDDVAAETLPGSGAKLDERTAAFRAVVNYLREHGTGTPAELREDVYPEHPARYTEGSDPARSWWKNAMYPALRELAERTDIVEKADTTGEWSWRGGGA